MLGLITVERSAFSAHRRSSLRVREMIAISRTCLDLILNAVFSNRIHEDFLRPTSLPLFVQRSISILGTHC